MSPLEAMGEAPKSAEASMKERIEGLEETLMRIQMAAARELASKYNHTLRAIVVMAQDAADGPSDPDRDRETPAEQVKP